jgi:hypothetical protein
MWETTTANLHFWARKRLPREIRPPRPRARLSSLEKDARGQGFLLIARQAEDLQHLR